MLLTFHELMRVCVWVYIQTRVPWFFSWWQMAFALSYVLILYSTYKIQNAWSCGMLLVGRPSASELFICMFYLYWLSHWGRAYKAWDLWLWVLEFIIKCVGWPAEMKMSAGAFFFSRAIFCFLVAFSLFLNTYVYTCTHTCTPNHP